MYILKNVDMAHSEPTLEDAICETSKRFPGLSIIQTGKTGGGGWPEVHLVADYGTLVRALASTDGWSMVEDPEVFVANVREIQEFVIEVS